MARKSFSQMFIGNLIDECKKFENSVNQYPQVYMYLQSTEQDSQIGHYLGL